jgi:hypothetical protein
LKKSFSAGERNFSASLVRPARGDMRGPHRFPQNRSQTFVAVLQRLAAAERTKNRSSRDFRCDSDLRKHEPNPCHDLKREVESEGRLIGDFGIVSSLRRPMLKHDAGRVSHSEDRSNVEQIQRAVGPLGQLFRTSFYPITKPLRCSSVVDAAAEPGSRQSFAKAARSYARAAFFMEVGAPPS